MRLFYASGLLSLLAIVSPLLTTVLASYPFYPLPMKYVHQWPLPWYIQSLYVRDSGDIMVTTVWPVASVWVLTDVLTDNPQATLIYKFDQVNATTAITETQPDVFAIIGANQTSLGVGIDGDMSIWELDLRPGNGSYTEGFTIKEIIHMSEAGLCGSLVPLPKDPSILLVADTHKGVVWRVDTRAREYELAAREEHMAWLPWFITEFGISGVKIQDGYLYWTLSYTATIWRIAISDDGFPLPGARPEEVKWIRSVFVDNFEFASRDNATIFAALNADNRLIAIDKEGNPTYVAGTPDELILLGPVSPAFGKVQGDTNTVYVATGGALLNPVNGSIIEGGRIVAIDTTPFFEEYLSKDPELELELRSDDTRT
ncbi:hypothetical protein F4806DRAFT_479341 [Annulohypoxylon nitens]|nr:hypothetical protein F4806DRAFT_479341 [Annulohypoxylon nitens]